MSEQLPVERKREKSTTNLSQVQVESAELVENQKRLKILAAQRLKERNDKYLEELKQKRALKQDKDDILRKQKEQTKAKLRDQVAKKNAEVIKQRMESKKEEP